MIVGGAEEGADGDVFKSQKQPTNHVGMKEVSDDDIRRLFDDFFSELYPRNCFYCNASGSEFWSEFTWFLECDNGVLEGIEQGEHAQKHVFTASVSEGLNDVNNFFLLSHIYPVKILYGVNYRVPMQVMPASGCSKDLISFRFPSLNQVSISSKE